MPLMSYDHVTNHYCITNLDELTPVQSCAANKMRKPGIIPAFMVSSENHWLY